MLHPFPTCKKIFNALLFTTATLALSSFAHADTLFDGWYVSGLLGAGLTPSIEFAPLDAPFFAGVDLGPTIKIEYKPAFNNPIIAAAIGYKSGPLRYELEALFATSKFRSIGDIEIGGDTKVAAALVNAFYDFDNVSTVVVPYLGLGIGYAHLSTDIPLFSDLAFLKASDNRFAFQGVLGTTINFTSNFGLFVDYRYLGTAKSNKAYFGEMYANNTFNLGITWHIGDYSNV